MNTSSTSLMVAIFCLVGMAITPQTIHAQNRSINTNNRTIQKTKLSPTITRTARTTLPTRATQADTCPKATNFCIGRNKTTQTYHLSWDSSSQANAFTVTYRQLNNTNSPTTTNTTQTNNLNLGASAPLSSPYEIPKYEVSITCHCGSTQSETVTQITQVETVRDIQ